MDKPKRAKERAHKSGAVKKNKRGGRNQSGLRAYNERRILSLIRAQGALPKAAIARQLGISAQTATVIMSSLEQSGLILKLAPQRGRVGQPSVPFTLNPDGAFGVGLKVGRRSYDLTLIDFKGSVRATLRKKCAYPTVDSLMSFLTEGIKALTISLSPELTSGICGIGVAMPYELWSWAEEVGAPKEEMEKWKLFDCYSRIAEITDLPVYVSNDDTAACAAELSFGNPHKYENFLYVFVGSFIGGGVVLNNSLVIGSRGNAGAIGSMPICGVQGNGLSNQLIMKASIYTLEKKMLAAGKDAGVIWNSTQYWGELGTPLEQWVDDVASCLAYTAACAASFFDFEAMIIDGSIPVSVREKIVSLAQEKHMAMDTRGLSSINILGGVVGDHAQSIGSGNLPLIAHFGENAETFLAARG